MIKPRSPGDGKTLASSLAGRRPRPTPLRREAVGRPIRPTPPALPDTEEGRLAVRIRQFRVEREWSQAELAVRMTRLGHRWHQTTVAKSERAERELKYSEVRALAEALAIPLEMLLDLEVSSAGTHVVAGLQAHLLKLEVEERAARVRLEFVEEDLADLTMQRKELSARLAALKREIATARRVVESSRKA